MNEFYFVTTFFSAHDEKYARSSVHFFSDESKAREFYNSERLYSIIIMRGEEEDEHGIVVEEGDVSVKDEQDRCVITSLYDYSLMEIKISKGLMDSFA